MANPKHLAQLRQGVDSWNQWKIDHETNQTTNRTKIDLRGADLSGANLSGVRLSGADLRGTNLCDASLRRADLSDAYLREASLSHASLSGASLIGANLSHANLSGAGLKRAGLSGANLINANLSGANLSEANISGVRLFETIFGNTNLTKVAGSDTCIHSGPSVLDHRTLAQSGPLPTIFLRGCGLPDDLITYLPSLLNQPIEFYSCFISYSTKDQDFADRLYADLQNNGVRCWFAPHDLQGGKKLHDQIDEAIRVYERLLLILSPASIASPWVETEIARARKRELREQRRMLFPVRLVDFHTLRDWQCFDADTGKDSAREIREYYIPDFSNWKDHDSYAKEFEKLLRDLKTPTAPPVI